MISKFKILPKGVQRAIIVASILIPLVLSITLSNRGEEFFVGILIFSIIYWILTFAGVWIYEGFKTEK